MNHDASSNFIQGRKVSQRKEADSRENKSGKSEGRFSEEAKRKFWGKVNKNGATARNDLGSCWIWKGGLSNGRYGTVTINKIQTGSHRASYEMNVGEIPKGMCVCHKCDVMQCVRPDHLFLGTKGDNNRDTVKKGRHVCAVKLNPSIAARGKRHSSRTHPEKISRGSNHYRAILRESDVIEIRNIGNSQKHSEIATRYGVGKSLISKINRRKIWRHI